MHGKNPRYKSSTQDIQTVTEIKLQMSCTCIDVVVVQLISSSLQTKS